MTELERKLLAENEQLKRELDVLRQNSTAEIEFVDERHLKFNNLTFCKNAAGYYRTAIALHQYVWIFHNGEIPQGCGIHHGKDGKDCNEIHNLTMKTNSEHATWHNTHDFITVKCTNCGKEFQTRKANRGKTCSRPCRHTLVGITRRERNVARKSDK